MVSVTVRVPLTSDTLAALLPFHTPTLDEGRPLDDLAREQCDEICRALGDALVQPGERTEPEASTVFTLKQLGSEQDANRWLGDRQREVAGVLSEFPGERLSEAQVADVLRLRRSFENSDLAVVDWDAALVVDLHGYAGRCVVRVGVGELQLEEFRWMDRSLDRYLEWANIDLARPR